MAGGLVILAVIVTSVWCWRRGSCSSEERGADRGEEEYSFTPRRRSQEEERNVTIVLERNETYGEDDDEYDSSLVDNNPIYI